MNISDTVYSILNYVQRDIRGFAFKTAVFCIAGASTITILNAYHNLFEIDKKKDSEIFECYVNANKIPDKCYFDENDKLFYVQIDGKYVYYIINKK